MSMDGFAAYALRDPTVAVPNLRRLMREGGHADTMQPVNPTVTWPNHTTLVTGVTPERHGLLYNGAPVRGQEGEPVTVQPHVEKEKLVRFKTVYDLAYRAGLTTSEVDWVAIEKAPTITWSFSEWPSVDGVVEREMMAAGLVTADELRGFAKAPITWRDEIWTEAAEHIIVQHKPNLMLFHLLNTDSVQHSYGARTLAAYTALALADARLGRIIDATRRAGIYPQTTFIVVSDHGFKTYDRIIRPNVILKDKGLAGQAWVIPEGGTAMLYVTRNSGRDAILKAATEALTGVEGIVQILTPAQYAQYGLPLPTAEERMSDLVLAAAPGYAFNGATTGDAVSKTDTGRGAHGYLSTDEDMGAIFVASGNGIRRGANLGRIRNLDVAPTIATLLGLRLDGIQGHVLSGLLSEGARQ